MPTSGNQRLAPGPTAQNCAMKEQLLRKYTKAKNGKKRKIDTMQHMLRALNNGYDQSSYMKIHEDLGIYDKQVDTIRNIVEQLEQLESNTTKDH